MTEALMHVNWNVHGERLSQRNSRYGSVISLQELRKIRRMLRASLHKPSFECGTFPIEGSDTYFAGTTFSMANIDIDSETKAAGICVRFPVRKGIF